MNRKTFGIIAALCVAVFLSSCGMESVVVKPGYDFKQIKRVAVITFKDPYSTKGSMVAEMFTKYLLKSGYNVIERDELNTILREHQLSEAGILNSSQVKEFGKICGVDAIITGSVTQEIAERDFYENGNPRFIAAQVGVTCRMISVETGEILWAGSDSYDATNIQTGFEYLVSSLVGTFIDNIRTK